MTYRQHDKQMNSFGLLLGLVASPELSTSNYTQWGERIYIRKKTSL
jgi:hypothetical protein